MNTHFFVGMLILGALVGGFLGGFNFRSIKGDSGRNQSFVAKRMVMGIIVGVIVGGLVGFFVH